MWDHNGHSLSHTHLHTPLFFYSCKINLVFYRLTHPILPGDWKADCGGEEFKSDIGGGGAEAEWVHHCHHWAVSSPWALQYPQREASPHNLIVLNKVFCTLRRLCRLATEAKFCFYSWERERERERERRKSWRVQDAGCRYFRDTLRKHFGHFWGFWAKQAHLPLSRCHCHPMQWMPIVLS